MNTTCIVATGMIQSSCGNIERRMYANDGRGSTLALEVSRLVADTAQTQSTRVFVRSQMGVQRIVSFIYQKVASINRKGSFGEDNQSFIELAISASSTKSDTWDCSRNRWHSYGDATCLPFYARWAGCVKLPIALFIDKQGRYERIRYLRSG